MQGGNNQSSELKDKKQLNAAIRWLQEQKQALSDRGVSNPDFEFDGGRSKDQIKAAIAFHSACEHMGETLQCFPDMILDLCNLFSYLDGYEMTVWESLGDKAFTKQNLSKWRGDAKRRALERKEDRRSRRATPKRANSTRSLTKSPKGMRNRTRSNTPSRTNSPKKSPSRLNPQRRARARSNTPSRNGSVTPNRNRISKSPHRLNLTPSRTPSSAPQSTTNLSNRPDVTPASESTTPKNGTTEPPSSPPFSDKKSKKEKLVSIKEFDKSTIAESRQWFATTQTGSLQADDFPSTNILALIHQTFVQEGLSEGSKANSRSSAISLNSKDWEVYSYTDSKGNVVYQARFVKKLIPALPLNGRGKNSLPRWMKRQMRPSSAPDERKCLPPQVARPKTSVISLGNNQRVLMYESIELAVKMEAAFWLDRQFCVHYKTGRRHWYQHDVAQMMAALRKNEEAEHDA